MSDEREQVDTANAAPIPPGRVSDLLEEIPRGTRRMSDELLEEIAGARMQVARHGSLGMPGPGQLLAVLVLAEERIIKADRAQKQLQDSLLRQAARIRELRAELEAERRATEEELGRCRKELNEWRSGLRCRAHSDEIRGISGTAAIEGFTGEGEFRHLTIRNGIITEARTADRERNPEPKFPVRFEYVGMFESGEVPYGHVLIRDDGDMFTYGSGVDVRFETYDLYRVVRAR